MNYPWAVVGAKVVCINAEIKQFDLPGVNYSWKNWSLRKDCVYTIREIITDHRVNATLTLKFEELIDRSENDKGYAIPRFKPLEKKKLPDVLTSLLTNPRKTVVKDQFDKQGTDA